MKYYCENCGAELVSNREPRQNCSVCGDEDSFRELPAHETVAQWEARKGRKYPYIAPVYYYSPAHDWNNVMLWGHTSKKAKEFSIVATEAGAPPDDWRPE
jgi:hypothetical protein